MAPLSSEITYLTHVVRPGGLVCVILARDVDTENCAICEPSKPLAKFRDVSIAENIIVDYVAPYTENFSIYMLDVGDFLIGNKVFEHGAQDIILMSTY